MTVLRWENLSCFRQKETEGEKNQNIEKVIPATTAISCHFLLFRFRQRLAFADDFNERPGCSPGFVMRCRALATLHGPRSPAAAGKIRRVHRTAWARLQSGSRSDG